MKIRDAMKIHSILVLCFGCAAAGSICQAVDLKQAKVTQVVNDVQIISAANQNAKAAAVNELFTMPDLLRTGPASRAELVAADETITRVGANTIFSFDPASRTINLKQGSLLFHSPHGKGGGAIRTGSATASVLGTTLIVTTTPKGGLKVINLEGNVEVKFLNGLKQKLTSGQMTFILTGGNQLAPIINIRLDELTRNSRLVKGFNQPLASLPLINNQIGKQDNMIRTGKATDTGLYAGDDADSDKVEVVDADTIHRSPLHAARRADATINQPSLLGALPSPPYHVFTDTAFPLPQNPFFTGELFKGFAARNIFFNTPGPAAPSLQVDMSPYSGMSAFDFVAVRNIHFAGSTTFNGLSPAATLSLIGGRQIAFAPGVTVRADVQNFLLRAPEALTLEEVRLLNLSGDTALTSGAKISIGNDSLIEAVGDLTLNSHGDLHLSQSRLAANSIALNTSGSGKVSLDRSVVDAPGGLTVASAGDVSITRSTINSSAASGTVSLGSAAGSATITDTSITARYLTVNSGDGILLDAGGRTLAASGLGAAATFTAPNLITINKADFSSFGVVNMAANTINLSDVNLGRSAVTLRSLLGLVNVGSSQSGYVNFIQNVVYNGGPAQQYVNLPPGSKLPGITVTTLP